MFACGDAVIKSIAGTWPPLAVATMRFALGSVGLGVMLYRREGLGGFRTSRPRLQLLRGAAMAAATVSYVCAIFVMPLADAVSIGFVGPMFTALLAALFLGEPVRGRSWVAIALAFGGVLIVLRPNLLALGPVAALPILFALGNSVYMIGNRLTIGDCSVLAQQFFVSAISATILGGATVMGHVSGYPSLMLTIPPWHVVARCALVAISASTGHWMIFRATMLSGPGTIAPMVYVQILVATAIGWAVFGNPPMPLTLLGIGVIIVSGLILWGGGKKPLAELAD